MNSKIKVYTNYLFLLYITLGISYLVFLISFSIKVLPGFVMQVLLLIEALTKSSLSINALISNSSFTESIFFGIISLVLIGITLLGIFKSIKQYIFSLKYLNTLKKEVKENEIEIINSSLLTVFTAGFINPKIYISNGLKKSLNQEEFNAVLFHEMSHKNDLDPLRSFIVQVINNILPAFPFKNVLFNSFKTSIELKSDQSSIEKLGNNKPIISALYTVLKHHKTLITEPILTYFSNMPGRIPVLTGNSNYNFKSVTSMIYTFLLVAILLPVIAFSSQFYVCDHLGECLKIFVTDLNSSTSSNLCNKHPMSQAESCSTN